MKTLLLIISLYFVILFFKLLCLDNVLLYVETQSIVCPAFISSNQMSDSLFVPPVALPLRKTCCRITGFLLVNQIKIQCNLKTSLVFVVTLEIILIFISNLNKLSPLVEVS